MYNKSSTIIADNNSGLAESSVILKARKVTIDSSGPKKTTIKVTRLEDKNLSTKLLTPKLFLIPLTIFLTFLLQNYIIFLPRVTTKS